MLPILGAVMPAVETVIDRLVPDKNAQAKMKVELATLAAKGELDQMAGQLKINMEEAKSPSIFVAGWRPFIGWGCGVVTFLPFIIWCFNAIAIKLLGLDLPEMTMEDMPDGQQITAIMLGMLGVAGSRTYEKMKGVARENHK